MRKSWDQFYSQKFDVEYLVKNTFFHLELFTAIWEKSPKKILEVGLGTGSMSIFFSYLGCDVTGLDNDKNILKKAGNLSRKLNGRVKFVYGGAFKLPFKDQSFDVVFHQGFLEHFSDEQIIKLLDEQIRVGRIVVFSVPNNFYPTKDFGDERLLSKKYWDKLISANFKLIKSKNYNPVRIRLFQKIPYKIVHTMYFAKITKK